jgi:hypothetical protein
MSVGTTSLTKILTALAVVFGAIGWWFCSFYFVSIEDKYESFSIGYKYIEIISDEFMLKDGGGIKSSEKLKYFIRDNSSNEVFVSIDEDLRLFVIDKKKDMAYTISFERDAGKVRWKCFGIPEKKMPVLCRRHNQAAEIPPRLSITHLPKALNAPPDSPGPL